MNGQALPPVRNFSPAEYNAGNQNWMVSQADNRKVYFANNNGLLEYNGEQWYSYTTPNESIVRSVHWHDGLLYTGSFMDFGYWEQLPDNTLTYISLVEKFKVSLKEDEQFWNIISNKSGVLFQSLDRLYTYNPTSGKIRTVLENPKLTKVFEVNNRIFYNVQDSGLFEFVTGKSILIASTEAINGEVIEMSDSGSYISIITSTNSLFKLDFNELELVSKNQFPRPITVYSATKLMGGDFAIGTISNGLLIVNKQGAVQYQIDKRQGLTNNTVLSVFEDLDKNLWLGLDNGIDFIDLQSPFKAFIDRTGRLGTVYAAYSKDSELYLGTNQGLYFKSAESTEFQFVEGTQGQVWMLKNIDGTLFCGHNLGTFTIEGTKAIKISGTVGTWDIQTLKNRPDILIQGSYNGLNVLENKGVGWQFRNKIDGFGISSKDIALVDNTIYVGHEQRGLYELKVDDQLETIIDERLVTNVGFGMKSDVITLGEDVLYSNDQGIYIKEKNSEDFVLNSKLSSLISSNGYSSGRMNKITENSFWLFTKKSLIEVVIEPINNSFETKRILVPQYKRSETKGYESIIQLHNDSYLMGTSQGYLLMDGKELAKSTNTLVLDRIIVTNKNNSQELLEIQNEHSISNNIKSIQFLFYTTEYDAFSNVKYQYKLNGSEKEWSKPFEQGSLWFENLSYGSYQLDIRAIVNGSLLETEISTEFEIEPPFYATKLALLFYLLILIGMLLLVGAFSRWYYKRKRDHELEKQKQQMELNLLKSQKDLADLKNQQLNSDIDSRNRELAVTTMAMIKKNETLNELKEELDNLPKTSESKSLKKMLEKSLNSKQDWLTFEEAFNNVDKDFFKKIKEMHPSLTSGDLRLCVYLRLNLSSKEVAPLLNISPRSVEIKRYRLRKKLGLTREESLTSYIVEI
ncbi:hypothetical protein NMS_0149 [Nonlabens marinus S1-08]|uniref:HTH luxR-type domain-containing protein n=2 Tax=Nonlabens TaxID=363408 RepID=W8VU03_9FLAO|nr:hypothetical protein NMS_0149 [Nonlabens marinus S1-08]